MSFFMQITLMHHGKPNLPPPAKLTAGMLQAWLQSYNTSGICHQHRPPYETCHIASNSQVIVCSDLPRSLKSAAMLGLTDIHHIEPMFRELALPHAHFPSPRLSINTWITFFRMLWFLGFSPNCESFREAKLRAQICAQKLKELAKQANSVLFIGHGALNRLIAKELLVSGWRGPRVPGKNYWEYGVYYLRA